MAKRKRPTIGKDLRARATKYADLNTPHHPRGTELWNKSYAGYTAGWISCARQTSRNLRITVEAKVNG